jgi:predicted extracellular nuclease
MMKKLLALITAVAFSVTVFGQTADLFFSEYIEGGSNNKALEIYNGTGTTIDLSNYLIGINTNGGSWSAYFSFPAGTTLSNGDVYVIAHADAISGILDVDDTAVVNPYSGGSSYVVSFNGDDVRALFKISGNDTTMIDIIGAYDGVDPGSSWSVAGTGSTIDHTLVRKSTVKTGNTDWTSSAGTSADDSEWIVKAKDLTSYLGSHNVQTDITSFTFEKQFAPATIDAEKHIASIKVVFGTPLTSLVPTITVSAGATINPASGVAHDFTDTVEYTVTCEDGLTSQLWKVAVSEANEPSHQANFASFSVKEQVTETIIDQENATVTCKVAALQGLDSLNVSFTLSDGAQVSPTTQVYDFTKPVKYDITAQDDTTTVNWTVNITNASNLAEITGFTVEGISGDAIIDSAGRTVKADVMAGTDITALTPTFTLSVGAQVSPTTAQDFTTAVVYKVTSEDTTVIVEWTVTITKLQAALTTIYNIQYTTDASGDSPLKGEAVRFQGIVTAADKYNCFVQDGSTGWNGIYVYGAKATVGAKVEVSGTVDEYNNLTEIKNPTIDSIEMGTTPSPIVVDNINDEQYEGMLITLNGPLTCASAVSSKNWTVTNASGTTFAIRNQLVTLEPAIGDVFGSITGLLSQYSATYQLCPRSTDDLTSDINDNVFAAFAFYPNPVKDQITLSGAENASHIVISNLVGQTMIETNHVKDAISVANLHTGLYLITIYDNQGNYRSEKFIKE